jgi:hypothetical protein
MGTCCSVSQPRRQPWKAIKPPATSRHAAHRGARASSSGQAAVATESRLVDPDQAADGGTQARPRVVQLGDRQQAAWLRRGAVRVDDVAPSGYALDRATIRQRKTGRPVRFELTDQTRIAVDEYLRLTGRKPGQFLFAGRWRRNAWPDHPTVCPSRTGAGGKHRSRSRKVWHALPAPREGGADLSTGGETVEEEEGLHRLPGGKDFASSVHEPPLGCLAPPRFPLACEKAGLTKRCAYCMVASSSVVKTKCGR